jgi:hypothetical protein
MGFVILNLLTGVTIITKVITEKIKKVPDKIAVIVVLIGGLILITGMVLNTIAIMGNGGMPVIGHTTTKHLDCLHIANPPRVVFPSLVDRYDGILTGKIGGKKSMGDFLIGGGITILFGIYPILMGRGLTKGVFGLVVGILLLLL